MSSSLSSDDAAWKKVLHFWFGAVPRTNLPTLFPTAAIAATAPPPPPPPPSSIESHIKKQYAALWFPSPSSGKQVQADRVIRERFHGLLRDAERGVLHDAWASHPLSLCALIIVLDQFSRHVYRNAVGPAENDAKALALSNLMLQRQWHLELPVPLAVFALMPLRHTPTVSRLETVVREIECRASQLRSAQDLLQKFRRTTVSRLSVLRSDTSGNGSGGGSSIGNGGTKEGRTTAVDGDAFEDILERRGFPANLDTIGQHSLVRTMRGFIQEYAHDGAATGRKQRRRLTNMVLAVSLSGGVDSMVIARILVHLRDELLAKNKKIPSSSRRCAALDLIVYAKTCTVPML